jgi:hypothetical protein
MGDMLLTLLVLCAIVALVCLAVIALGVLPFVLAVDAAERRGFSPTRWGAGALAGIVLALGLALWTLHGDHSKVLLVPAVLLSWGGVGVLCLLSTDQTRIGGTQGAHER